MKYLSLIISVLFFAGCSATKIAVDESFWSEKKNSKIGIVVTKIPEPDAYKAGGQGLLDMAINEAMSSTLEDHLKTIDINSFKEIKNIFKTRLEKEGYNNVKFVDEEIDPESLPVFKGKTEKKACNKDFRSLKEKHDLDLLIVFRVNKYGTLRSYYGFIPLDSPKGLFLVHSMMINLATNEYEWYREMEEKESTKEVFGEWDEEPDFPNLTAAVIEAMENSKEVLKKYFFLPEN